MLVMHMPYLGIAFRKILWHYWAYHLDYILCSLPDYMERNMMQRKKRNKCHIITAFNNLGWETMANALGQLWCHFEPVIIIKTRFIDSNKWLYHWNKRNQFRHIYIFKNKTLIDCTRVLDLVKSCTFLKKIFKILANKYRLRSW